MATRRYVELPFNKEFSKFLYLLDEESYKSEEYRKIAIQVGWIRAFKRYIKNQDMGFFVKSYYRRSIVITDEKKFAIVRIKHEF